MKRLGSLIAAATCVVAFSASAPSSAASFQTVNCVGVAPVGGTITCAKPFYLDDFSRVSRVSTHANFHARISSGSVTMEWFEIEDGVHHLVARWVCNAPGLYVAARLPTGTGAEAGAADASTIPNCSEDLRPAAAFALGEQWLVVTARAQMCLGNDSGQPGCPFHGYLQLVPTIVPA